MEFYQSITKRAMSELIVYHVCNHLSHFRHVSSLTILLAYLYRGLPTRYILRTYALSFVTRTSMKINDLSSLLSSRFRALIGNKISSKIPQLTCHEFCCLNMKGCLTCWLYRLTANIIQLRIR